MIPAAWLARERPPGRGGPRWCRVESVAAQRRSGRGGGDLHAKPLGFALDALVAPARMLGGQPDDQLLHVRVRWRRPVWRCGSVHAPATSRRCQRSRVSGLTRKHDQRALGSTRLTAASRARPGRFQPGTWGLATEHGELVAQDQEFQVLGSIAAGEQGQELDGAAQGQVGESGQHAGWPPQRRLRTGARYRLVIGTRSSQAVPHFPHPTAVANHAATDGSPCRSGCG